MKIIEEAEGRDFPLVGVSEGDFVREAGNAEKDALHEAKDIEGRGTTMPLRTEDRQRGVRLGMRRGKRRARRGTLLKPGRPREVDPGES